MGNDVLPFWENISLWKEPVAASMIIAFICGFIGIYVILKRIVFVAAALGQIAGLGVAIAYWIASFIGLNLLHNSGILFISLMSLVFVCTAAFLLSFQPRLKRIPIEGIIGIVYLLGASLVLIVASSISQGMHEINNILFGNAVAVETKQLIIVSIIALILFIIHLIFFKEFVFITFDHDTAATLGIPTKIFNVILFVGIGVLISEATKTIGALPVFAFIVLPPIGALLLSNCLKRAFILSSFFGIFSAFSGYYLSWIKPQLPTGPSMVVLSAATLMPGIILFIINFVINKIKN